MKITPELIPDVVEFRIRNFGKYNPRKDVERSSWFRLSNTWYSHRDYHGLTGAQLVLIPVLLGVYSESTQDYIDVSLSYLRDHLKSKINHIRRTLAVLHNREFIEINNLLTLRDVALRTNERTLRTNEEEKGDLSKSDPPPDSPDTPPRPKGPSPSQLVEIWNQHRGSLPGVLRSSKGREAKARARLSEEPDLAYWEGLVKTMAETPFLCGKNDRKWRADFDWLVANDTNHVKVSEGKYGPANASGDNQPPEGEGKLARAKRQIEENRRRREAELAAQTNGGPSADHP